MLPDQPVTGVHETTAHDRTERWHLIHGTVIRGVFSGKPMLQVSGWGVCNAVD